jgi:serine/threonine protein phosphatase 1
MAIKQHQNFEKNSHGRDYLIGDLHGRHIRLMSQLKAMHFDFKKDRLFAVGDLVDRYDENLDCAKLLDEPWFFSVIGNHEQMFLKATSKKATTYDIAIHVQNGGWWAYESTDGGSSFTPTADAMTARKAIKEHCSQLMTIECDSGSVGVVHADAPDVWPGNDTSFTFNDDYVWNCKRFIKAKRFGAHVSAHFVSGVDAVVHGHNPSAEFVQNGNHLWIDTGNYGSFCIMTTDEAIGHAKRQMLAHKKFEPSNASPWMK